MSTTLPINFVPNTGSFIDGIDKLTASIESAAKNMVKALTPVQKAATNASKTMSDAGKKSADDTAKAQAQAAREIEKTIKKLESINNAATKKQLSALEKIDFEEKKQLKLLDQIGEKYKENAQILGLVATAQKSISAGASAQRDRQIANSENYNNMKKAAGVAGNLSFVYTELAAKVFLLQTAYQAVLQPLVNFISLQANFIDQIGDLSQKTGVNADNIQTLNMAFERTGYTVEDVDGILSTFSSNLDKAATIGGRAARGFKLLGIETRDANGNIRDANSVFEEAVTKIGKLKTVSEQAAAINLLFGENGKKMLAAFGDLSNFENFSKLAKEFGLDVGPKAAEAAGNWEAAVSNFKMTIKGVKNLIYEELVEPLTKFVIGLDISTKALTIFTTTRLQQLKENAGPNFVGQFVSNIKNSLTGDFDKVKPIQLVKEGDFDKAITETDAKLKEYIKTLEDLTAKQDEKLEKDKKEEEEEEHLGSLISKQDTQKNARESALKDLSSIQSQLTEDTLSGYEKIAASYDDELARLDEIKKKLIENKALKSDIAKVDAAKALVPERIARDKKAFDDKKAEEDAKKKEESDKKHEDALIRIGNIRKAASESSLSEEEKILAAQKEKFAELDKILKGNPELAKEAGDARIAIEADTQQQLADLDQERHNEALKKAKEHIKKIAGFLTGMASGAVGIVDGLLSKIAGIDLNSLLSAKNAGDVKEMTNTATQTIKQFVKAAPMIIDALVEELPSLFDALISAIPKLMETLAEKLPDLLMVLVKKIPQVLTAIVENLPMLVEALAQALPEIIEELANNIAPLVEAIIIAVPKIVIAIVKALPAITVALAKGLFQIGKTLVVTIVDGLFDAVKRIGRALAQAFGDSVKELFTAGKAKTKTFNDTPGPVSVGPSGMTARFAPGDTVVAARSPHDLLRQAMAANGVSTQPAQQKQQLVVNLANGHMAFDGILRQIHNARLPSTRLRTA